MNNPPYAGILASSPGNLETSLSKHLTELRLKGNRCFHDEAWIEATEFYSKCIDLALSCHKFEPQGVASSSKIHEEVKENLVCAYSNRAEARIKLKEYEDALQDCDKALALDQHHLKSLVRKGRAFHYLREYKLACQCFDRALQQSPGASDIQMHYEKSMRLNRQNKQAEFDLSPYFTNACSAPECSNYIGPVLIKKSLGRGRGLFATDNVDVGDFLLVDDAIALTSLETTALFGSVEKGIQLKEKHEHIKQDLEAQIICSAGYVPLRVLEQLQYLADLHETMVPPMDLFMINNGSWNSHDFFSHGWELDEDKFAKILLNVAYHTQTIDSGSCISSRNEQYGLWALPSFISHSCSPNANYIVVGEAMFVIAARKIEVGEEITISYVTGFEPLYQRESVFEVMGFKCECKRCMLERSLLAAEGSALQEIAEIREVTMLSDLELCRDGMRVETAIESLSTEEKQMIRASFFPLYFEIFSLLDSNPNARTPNFPSLREVFDGFHEVVPGSCACLTLFGRFPDYAKNESETDKVLFKKTLEVCRAYMGKHEEGLLKAVLNAIATDAFNPGYTVFLSTKTISYAE